jgi:hypothetical protein
MERRLNPTTSRKPISRLRNTLGVWVIVLGLTIIVGPTAIFLFVGLGFPRHFDQDTMILWQYLSIFGSWIYGPVGLVTIIIGLCLRQAGGWLIALGMTVILVPLAILIATSPSLVATNFNLILRHSLVMYGGSLGLVIVGIGLWVRQRSLRLITVHG